MYNLQVCTFNLENFFIKEALTNCDLSLVEEDFFRSHEDLLTLANVFSDINADIYGLCEIGERESIEFFNDNYLDNQYDIFHLKGNSQRGIEIAFLVRKNLPFQSKIKGFSHRSFDNPYTEEKTHYIRKSGGSLNFKLSRNLLLLELFTDDQLKAQLYLCHLKSARDEYGIDFRSQKRRESELKLSLKIIEENKKKTAPIIFMGDFNGNASRQKTDQEFQSLYQSSIGFKDILEDENLPLEYRATYFVFNKKKRFPIQLDYIFISKELHNQKLDSAIYRFKNQLGRPKPFPKNKTQVQSNPSDHYPLCTTVQL